MSNRKVLVMSVGGSPEPLIHSIDNIKPKLVYFIHSEKTLSVVDEINKLIIMKVLKMHLKNQKKFFLS